MERTVVLIKPDAMQRGLVGEILHRFERKGIKIIGIKMINFGDEVIESWYAHHRDKSFFEDIRKFMKWTPIVAMVLEGVDVIATVRKMVGVTKGREAEMGSIRGDFGMSGSQNLIHASDSKESAEKEIGLVFKPAEIFSYKSGADELIYSKEDL